MALARRGLEPQAHREGNAAHRPLNDADLLREMGSTVRSQFRALRRRIDSHVQAGGDWRDTLAALRVHTPALWQGWSDNERRRFLRHVQPYWDAHRHRCAPHASARWQALRASGQLSVQAGRIVAAQSDGNEIHVALRGRGHAFTHDLTVDWVVNCTGPDTRVRFTKLPLLRDLLERGALVADPNGLGIQVTSGYAVISSRGHANQRLHYVGPMLKARDWEATAVPELRQHAWRLAMELLQLSSAQPQNQNRTIRVANVA